MEKRSQLTIVISGSFRKHLSGIQEKIKEFEDLGIKVLSPDISRAINPEEEFVILESDTTTDPKRLEERHLDAIEEASALYLFNPSGYLGNSAQLEMGYALGLRKPIYSFEEMTDVSLRLFCTVASPEKINRVLRSFA
jgi:hypothetical protein